MNLHDPIWIFFHDTEIATKEFEVGMEEAIYKQKCNEVWTSITTFEIIKTIWNQFNKNIHIWVSL